MREIWFRGFAKTGWAYGHYWSNEMGNYFIREVVDTNSQFIIEDFEVDPKTIGQYIGLEDKNGVRICEGDVCEVILHGEKFTATAMYDNGCFALVDKGLVFWPQEKDDLVVEVKGNIHERKEGAKC